MSEFTENSRLVREIGGEPVQEFVAVLERLFEEHLIEYQAAKALAAKYSGENTHLKVQIKSLRAEIAKQAERIKDLLDQQYGQKSEAKKRGKGKPQSGSEDQSDDTSPSRFRDFAEKKPKKPRNINGRGTKNWGNLDRIEVEMDFPETCPCGCGGTIRSYDIDEKREVIPAKFYIAVRKYPRYRCRNESVTIGTLYKPSLMPGLTVGTSILAYLVTMRFGWGMPWYRIENMLNHAGTTYHRATMCKQIGRLASTLERVSAELMRHTLDEAQRVFVDETPIKILRPGTGKTGQAFMYAVHRDDSSFGGNAPRSTVYFHRLSRSMEHIHGILAGKSLIVQHDGYPGYGRLGQPGTDVEDSTSVDCWIHTRRNFIKTARTTGSKFAEEIVERIAELYKVEDIIRGWPPDSRLSYRKDRSTSVTV